MTARDFLFSVMMENVDRKAAATCSPLLFTCRSTGPGDIVSIGLFVCFFWPGFYSDVI